MEPGCQTGDFWCECDAGRDAILRFHRIQKYDAENDTEKIQEDC